MKNFDMTNEEKEYLQEINRLIHSDADLSYVIGIDKITGERRFFLIHVDNSTGTQIVYVISEILRDNSASLEDIYFEFSDNKNNYDLTYKKNKWYHKLFFWK